MGCSYFVSEIKYLLILAKRMVLTMAWFVYMVRCSDESLYTGVTNDLDERIAAHNAGKGAKYTSVRSPVSLAYHEPVESESIALKRELQIKGWSKKKESLIDNNLGRAKRLAQRRSVYTMEEG